MVIVQDWSELASGWSELELDWNELAWDCSELTIAQLQRDWDRRDREKMEAWMSDASRKRGSVADVFSTPWNSG